ncbi:MAG: flagellar basal-body rod protein FlgG [Ignavibacteriae bacterium]|nr:MAG: flagellar basal-body rod protein FlgG [Ignavibacteriota bacterium]
MSSRALRSAASGMYAQQVNIQVISNNIANMNTTSFKKNRAEFKDLLYQEVVANPKQEIMLGTVEDTDSKIQIGSGVKVTSTQKNFQQGDLQQSSQMLDVAIYGDGFFQIRRPDGSFVYTRDGSFKISSEGSLVTNDGFVVEPGFTIDEQVERIVISKEGVITAQELTGETIPLGNIELAKFINPGGLVALGDNLYAESPASGPPMLGQPAMEGFGDLKQGYLESSNVDVVEEMISMISAQRAYEINSKTVKTVEDMMSIANNLKR